MTTYQAPAAALPTAFPDASAALRWEYACIVRTQNARTTDGPATGGHPRYEFRTDAELDAALTGLEKHFIDRMDIRAIDPDRRGEYADAMRIALTEYADAITRADTVQQPRGRHLATTDTERAAAHLAILTPYPEATGLLDALTDIEGAHAAIYAADGTRGGSDLTGYYLKAINTARAVADDADTRYGIAPLAPAAYGAFLLAVPHYAFHRAALASPDTSIDHHAELASALASRLDRARADMAAAFARDRRGAAARSRARATSSSV